MLERLQAAFSSQRNFINDAIHELRTPITIIRGHLELLVTIPKSEVETVGVVIDELDRMVALSMIYCCWQGRNPIFKPTNSGT